MASSIVASACLLGIPCRYDGGHRCNEKVKELSAREKVVPLCPEQMGGLEIPRPPAEISGGSGQEVLDGKARVIDAEGKDVTPQFLKGAALFLEAVQKLGSERVIMKEKSPSCGVRKIYSGGVITAGMGVTTAFLMREGFKVISDEEL